MRKIGFDFAHSEIKMATAETIVTVPCRVARTEPAQLAGYRKARTKMVTVGETVAYVGIGDELPADTSMFGDNWQARAVTYAALYDLLDEDEHTIRMVVGLPVAPMIASDWRATKRSLVWLDGIHQWAVGKSQKARSIFVEQKIILPQPFGAYYNFLLADDGRLRADRREMFGLRVAVVDIGDNTLDLVCVESGQPVQGMSTGQPLGLSWAASELQKSASQHGQVLSVEECGGYIERRLRNKHTVAPSGFDLARLAENAVDTWIAQIKNTVLRTWSRDHGAALTLVTGGPARVVARELSYRNVVVADNPVKANVRGLAKFAQREVWA